MFVLSVHFTLERKIITENRLQIVMRFRLHGNNQLHKHQRCNEIQVPALQGYPVFFSCDVLEPF